MANVFQKALFRTPKYNVFPQENEVKLSYEVGKLIPVQYWDLVPGDSIKTHLSQLTRMAPMLAPIFQRFKIDFHAFAIPHRLAIPMKGVDYNGYMDGFEDFHNLAISDSDRPEMPHFSMSEYLSYLYDTGINPIGTLWDYLGYPTFEKVYRGLKKDVDLQKILSLSNAYIWDGATSTETSASTAYTISYDGHNISVGSIIWWIANGCPKIVPLDDYNQEANFIEMLDNFNTTGAIVVNKVRIPLTDIELIQTVDIDIDIINQTIIDTFGSSQAAIDHYLDAIFLQFLSDNATALLNPSGYPDMSLLPFYAYYSAVYDWYINTNLVPDCEDKTKWFYSIGLPLAPSANGKWLFDADLGISTVLEPLLSFPRDAYWSNDYFTSAFNNPQRGSAGTISAGMTIPQLRDVNSMQELAEKLLYSGKRPIDVNKVLFGVSSSDARCDRTQPIGSFSSVFNIADVMQTSQGDVDSQLGGFAGQGISVGKKDRAFIDFQAEEHTLVMVFMRVRPNAIYESNLNHLLIQTDPYDFLIPDFAQVGEQPIQSCEVDSSSANTIFGWTRRYAQYMFTPSHVHGDFKTSLDYWHDARRFDSKPSLNVEFATITDKDDLNRIFAVPGAKEHFYSYIHFNTAIARPLSKYVQYSL